MHLPLNKLSISGGSAYNDKSVFSEGTRYMVVDAGGKYASVFDAKYHISFQRTSHIFQSSV